MFASRSFSDAIIALVAVILLVIYIRTEYHKPIVTEAASLRYPHQLGFPSWFARGQSPYDVILGGSEAPEDGMERVLILHDPSRNDRTTYAMTDYFDALKVQGMQFSLQSTLGHSEQAVDNTCSWDWTLTIGATSQEKTLPNGCKTVPVIQYGAESTVEPERLGLGRGVSLLDATKSSNAEVVTSVYTGAERDLGLIALVLPAANHDKFYPKRPPFGALRKQVTFFTAHKFWSTRAELETRLPAGWRSHLVPNVTASTSVVKVQRALKKAESDMAREMRSSGVCVFDGWSAGELTEFTAQAMLSGCVVATTTPTLQAEDLTKLFLITERPEGSLNENSMFKAVNDALSQTSHEDLDRKALWAFIYAREKLTFTKRLADIRTWVQGYRDGQRGVMLPFGYRHNIPQL